MKPRKSADELEAMIMQEVAKHPDWGSIEGVAITRPVQSALHQPNWRAAFVMDGPRPVSHMAEQFARELSAKVDLDQP
jgi:hypothetical protein